ncbi:MAG TPA: hypothetical protein VF932_10760 [Anaerolineae bacterium]
MPKDLKDFPRPPSDNGRGLNARATSGWSGDTEGYANWIAELVAMGIKWLRVLDDGGDSVAFCEKLLQAGIFPIVRILRKDPPPNDLPEPNPGHIGIAEEQTIQRLIAAGVRYFETNNEPDLATSWKHHAMPGNPVETAKLVALNWMFDARLILAMGGLPSLPAISAGGNMDLMGALVALGRQDILLEGCWIAIHNYPQNRPLAYPEDPVNRSGLPLTAEQYDQGPYTEWVWWNSELGRVDKLNHINAMRAAEKNPTLDLVEEHSCFREFEYYDRLAIKYLGRSIPILGTEGGFLVGRRDDPRYPRITPDAHRDQTVALFDFMQRQSPDYYFVSAPSLLLSSPGREMDAWISSYWSNTARTAGNGIPPLPMPDAGITDRLPVIDAVKAMPNLARRLPGAQPAPPVQPAPVPIVVPTRPPLAQPAAPIPSAPEFALEDTSAEITEMEPPEAKPVPVEPPEMPALEPDWSEPFPVEPEVPEPATMTAATEMEQEEMSEIPLPPPPPSPQKQEKDKSEDKRATPARPATSPLPSLSLLFSSLPVPLMDWDPRLDAINVSFEPAKVSPGQMYWKLIRAEYQGPSESNGKHHIFFTVEDEMAKPVEYQRVWQGWPEDKTDATTNEKGEANIPLWASFAPERGESGQYSAWIDGLPSDRVNGMGLPSKRQVCFLMTWRRVIA